MLIETHRDDKCEIGRCYGMEMNVEKTKVLRIARQPSPIQIMIDQKHRVMWNISTVWVAC